MIYFIILTSFSFVQNVFNLLHQLWHPYITYEGIQGGLLDTGEMTKNTISKLLLLEMEKSNCHQFRLGLVNIEPSFTVCPFTSHVMYTHLFECLNDSFYESYS